MVNASLTEDYDWLDKRRATRSHNNDTWDLRATWSFETAAIEAHSLVLSRTRLGLRRAVRTVNGILETLDLTQHPDKTFIGRIERGFDFLGYHFSRDANGVQSLSLAAKTIANFQDKLLRHYEQARHAKTYKRSEQDAWSRNHKPKNIKSIIESYTRRWFAKARGGIESCSLSAFETR